VDWGKRQRRFSWVNDIDYAFGANGRCRLKLHMVVCEESRERVDQQAAIVTETARHAWLSSQPLSCENVHAHCDLGARHRWGIEAGFLVEQHQGYHYEHAFALDWNAMRGYHLLMRLAHVFNTLARCTRQLRDLFQGSRRSSCHRSTPSSRTPHHPRIQPSPAASPQQSDRCSGESGGCRQSGPIRQGHASGLPGRKTI